MHMTDDNVTPMWATGFLAEFAQKIRQANGHNNRHTLNADLEPRRMMQLAERAAHALFRAGIPCVEVWVSQHATLEPGAEQTHARLEVHEKYGPHAYADRRYMPMPQYTTMIYAMLGAGNAAYSSEALAVLAEIGSCTPMMRGTAIGIVPR